MDRLTHHYICRPITEDDYQAFDLGEARLPGDYLQGGFNTGALYPFSVMVHAKLVTDGRKGDWHEGIAYRDGERFPWEESNPK